MTSPEFGTGLGDTFMRLGGDLARAEKQFRECLPSQYDRAREIMRQAGDRWRDHIDSMIASQRRMVESGTGSETSPDAGASMREALEWIEDTARVAAGGFQGQPSYWTFQRFEEIRQKAMFALEASAAKPAVAQAEAEQSPQPAGLSVEAHKAALAWGGYARHWSQCANNTRLGAECDCGLNKARKAFVEAVAQAPTRTGKGPQ